MSKNVRFVIVVSGLLEVEDDQTGSDVREIVSDISGAALQALVSDLQTEAMATQVELETTTLGMLA